MPSFQEGGAILRKLLSKVTFDKWSENGTHSGDLQVV